MSRIVRFFEDSEMRVLVGVGLLAIALVLFLLSYLDPIAAAKAAMLR